jgi:hypothetical protein
MGLPMRSRTAALVVDRCACSGLTPVLAMYYPTVRSILLHMIVETACHAGHLNAARELLVCLCTPNPAPSNVFSNQRAVAQIVSRRRLATR